MKKILCTIALLFAIGIPFSSNTVASASTLPKMTVNASSLIVREYPSPSAKSIGQVTRGQVLYIHSMQPGGWAEIRINTYQKGYVAASYLKGVTQPATSPSSYSQKATVTLSTLLVREYPSPKARSIASLKRGNGVYITATKPGGWAEIRFNTNQKGYVPAAYVKVETKPAATTPIYNPTFKPGQYLIGKTIQPGIYYSTGGVDYWERQSGLGGSMDEIIANNIPVGQEYVEIKSTDRGFKFEGGTFSKFNPNNHNHKLRSEFSDGTYLVGIDIRPGFYRGYGDGYWARLSGVTGDLDEIITNDLAEGTLYVQIDADDFAFNTSGIKWQLIK